MKMKLDHCYFINNKTKTSTGKVWHKLPFGIVDGKACFNKDGYLYHTENTYKELDLLGSADKEKLKNSFTGIILKDEGSYISDDERVLVIDIDMKDTPNYTFEDLERRKVYVLVCGIFGIPSHYREMEKTQNKGIHIFVKVKDSQILRNGSFFINDSDFTPCTQQTKRKIEVEIFQQRKCIITAPSPTYHVWKKTENRIDWNNLFLLENLPDVIQWDKESKAREQGTGTEKRSIGAIPELERKLELIYKDLFYEKLEEEFSSLKFDYSRQPFQIFRVATGENVQVKQFEDGNFYIQAVRFNRSERKYKKTKVYNCEMLEQLEKIYLKF